MFTTSCLRTRKESVTHLWGVVLHVELHLELVLVVAHFGLWAHVRLAGLQRHASVYTRGHKAGSGEGRGKGLSGRRGEDGGDSGKGVKVREPRGDSKAGIEVAELPLLLLDPPVESRLWPFLLAVVARAA